MKHDALLEVLERTGWASQPRGGQPRPTVTPVPEVGPQVQHVERDGAQTHLVVGRAPSAMATPGGTRSCW